jgi:hypothetical protein
MDHNIASDNLKQQEKKTNLKSQNTETKAEVSQEKIIQKVIPTATKKKVQDQETLDVVFVGDKTGHKIKAKKKDTPPNPSNALENVTISQFEVPSARFDAQSYVDHVFECEDEETIRTLFQEKLSEMKENAATHLQRVVHRNYQQFIAASKEILSLEAEMLELRNRLNELNSTLKSFNRISFHFDNTPIPSRRTYSLLKKESKLIEDIDWLLELPDQLDIVINERRFDAAINLIQKAENIVREKPSLEPVLASIHEDFTAKIQNLVDHICRELSNPSLKKKETQTLVNYLSQLGYETRAKGLFFEMRSTRLKNIIRMLYYEGDIVTYVKELSRVVFTEIDATYDDFRMCFSDSSSSSSFVTWAMRTLESYVAIFRRQVFSVDVSDFKQIKKCLDIAYSHCKILHSKGLELNFFLRRMFYKDLITLINNFHSRGDTNLNKILAEENWEQRQFDTGARTVLLTESAIFISIYLRNFICDFFSVATTELVPSVVSTITKFLEKYLFDLSQIVENKIPQLTDTQCLAIICNASYVKNELLCFIRSYIEEKIHRQVYELKQSAERLNLLSEDLRKFYCTFRANDILNNTLNWNSSNYSHETFDESNASPSQNFIRMFEYLYTLGNDINRLIGPNSVKEIIQDILEQVACGLIDGLHIISNINNIPLDLSCGCLVGHFWDNEKNRDKSMFGENGIHQLILDMKFCLQAVGNFATAKV